jgi:hypothetical protein
MVASITQEALDNAKSVSGFTEQVRSQGYEVYTRNGQLIGIVGKKKYRFSSLQILLDKLYITRNTIEGLSLKGKRAILK